MRCRATTVFPVPGPPSTTSAPRDPARMMASWSAWIVPSTSRIWAVRVLPRLAMNADWSSSAAACPAKPVGSEHLVPVVADPAEGPAVPAAAQPGPWGSRGWHRRTVRPLASASRRAGGDRSLSVRPSRPTYTGSGSSAATIWPRQRSRPKRRSVRSRAVSRWTSRSRSMASWPMPPGALRWRSRRAREVGDRLCEACSRSQQSAARHRRSGGGQPWRRGGREGRTRWWSEGSRHQLRSEDGHPRSKIWPS